MYHSSVGSPVADFVAARDEPLIVDYHNITPASFFARWEPAVAGALMKGRRQLAELEARADLGLADSAFNAQELDRPRIRADRRRPDPPRHRDPRRRARRSRRRSAASPTRKARGGADWLFVGRLAPNKAQHDLVKAFAAYRRLYDGRRPAASRRRVVVAPVRDSRSIAFIDALDLGRRRRRDRAA